MATENLMSTLTTVKKLGEFKLSTQERQVLELRKEKSFSFIARTVFGGKRSPQAIQQLIQRLERKQWICGARDRYADDLGNCPIEESPLPPRVQRALIAVGITKVRQLVDAKASIPDVGKMGMFYIKRLMSEWAISKPATYCVSCGAVTGGKHREPRFNTRCRQCGVAFSVVIARAA